jgi:hypothetical protein
MHLQIMTAEPMSAYNAVLCLYLAVGLGGAGGEGAEKASQVCDA